MARHEFQRTFNVFRDLRIVDMVLGLPWLDAEQASVQFGTTLVFTLMDGIAVEAHTAECRQKRLVMSHGKVQKVMRKTRQSKGCNAKEQST
jgi:hypothetical protein